MTIDSNPQIVADAFAAWSAGTGYISTLFATEMRWEIVGRSAASKEYRSAQEFIDEVLQPFSARFDPDDPFRPVRVRAIYGDDSQDVVAVVWDGRGTTTAGTTYENTYAWFLRFEEGKVIEGTAFYDSIAFNELWENVSPGL